MNKLQKRFSIFTGLCSKQQFAIAFSQSSAQTKNNAGRYEASRATIFQSVFTFNFSSQVFLSPLRSMYPPLVLGLIHVIHLIFLLNHSAIFILISGYGIGTPRYASNLTAKGTGHIVRKGTGGRSSVR